MIHRYDGRLLLLNLVFLMTIVFIPWPTAVLGHYGNYVTAWVLYAVAMAGIGFAATALWWYGSGDRGLADGVTPRLRRYYAVRALIQPAIFLLSIPVAAVSLGIAQLCCIPMFVGLYVVNRTFGRGVTEVAGPTGRSTAQARGRRRGSGGRCGSGRSRSPARRRRPGPTTAPSRRPRPRGPRSRASWPRPAVRRAARP